MNDPHFRLTPEVQQQVCALIRAGGFPDSSAEAVGIPAEVFRRWLRYGQSRRPNPLYRNFLLAVRQAQGHARVLAEHAAHDDRPLDWLKNGPGKETARLPGWTSPVKPATLPRKEGGLSARRAQELITVLLRALVPFPEARVALAETLREGGLFTEVTEDPPPATEAELPVPVAADNSPAAASCAPGAPPQASDPTPAPPGAPPVMETKCFDMAPAPAPARCPEVSVKVLSTCGEPVVNLQRTHNGTATGAAVGGGNAREKPRQTGPGPWDSLDSGHWIVFSTMLPVRGACHRQHSLDHAERQVRH